MLSKNRGLRVLAVVFIVLVMLGMSLAVGAKPVDLKERPFRLSFSGSVEVVVSAAWCGSSPWVGVLIVGDGHATHLGRVSAEASQCTNGVTGEVANGVVTLVAANGDELYGTYVGGPGSSAPVEATQTFIGGTGRFANATGQAFELAYPNDPEPGLVWGTIEGTISYNASDRSH